MMQSEWQFIQGLDVLQQSVPQPFCQHLYGFQPAPGPSISVMRSDGMMTNMIPVTSPPSMIPFQNIGFMGPQLLQYQFLRTTSPPSLYPNMLSPSPQAMAPIYMHSNVSPVMVNQNAEATVFTFPSTDVNDHMQIDSCESSLQNATPVRFPVHDMVIEAFPKQIFRKAAKGGLPVLLIHRGQFYVSNKFVALYSKLKVKKSCEVALKSCITEKEFATITVGLPREEVQYFNRQKFVRVDVYRKGVLNGVQVTYCHSKVNLELQKEIDGKRIAFEVIRGKTIVTAVDPALAPRQIRVGSILLEILCYDEEQGRPKQVRLEDITSSRDYRCSFGNNLAEILQLCEDSHCQVRILKSKGCAESPKKINIRHRSFQAQCMSNSLPLVNDLPCLIKSFRETLVVGIVIGDAKTLQNDAMMDDFLEVLNEVPHSHYMSNNKITYLPKFVGPSREENMARVIRKVLEILGVTDPLKIIKNETAEVVILTRFLSKIFTICMITGITVESLLEEARFVETDEKRSAIRRVLHEVSTRAAAVQFQPPPQCTLDQLVRFLKKAAARVAKAIDGIWICDLENDPETSEIHKFEVNAAVSFIGRVLTDKYNSGTLLYGQPSRVVWNKLLLDGQTFTEVRYNPNMYNRRKAKTLLECAKFLFNRDEKAKGTAKLVAIIKGATQPSEAACAPFEDTTQLVCATWWQDLDCFYKRKLDRETRNSVRRHNGFKDNVDPFRCAVRGDLRAMGLTDSQVEFVRGLTVVAPAQKRGHSSVKQFGNVNVWFENLAYDVKIQMYNFVSDYCSSKNDFSLDLEVALQKNFDVLPFQASYLKEIMGMTKTKPLKTKTKKTSTLPMEKTRRSNDVSASSLAERPKETQISDFVETALMNQNAGNLKDQWQFVENRRLRSIDSA